MNSAPRASCHSEKLGVKLMLRDLSAADQPPTTKRNPATWTVRRVTTIRCSGMLC